MYSGALFKPSPIADKATAAPAQAIVVHAPTAYHHRPPIVVIVCLFHFVKIPSPC
ncbi:hypothetical protein U1Q18_028033, partial [Sarracenia purpurea var. burkii]